MALEVGDETVDWWKKSGKLTSWGPGSLSNYLQGFLYIPGGCLGFLNHQQMYI